MSISKTTLNFAEKRNLCVYVNEGEDSDLLCIDVGLDLSEPSFVYLVNTDGSFSFSSLLDNQYKAIKEELPATIKNEKHLREVLLFISKEIKG